MNNDTPIERLRITDEPRGDHLTNRCVVLERKEKTLRFIGWRGDVELNISYDGEHKFDAAQKDDGYEFDLTLGERPRTNRFEFAIASRNLNFYRQPALTEEEIARGDERSDRVVGSYAVYHSTRRDNWRHADGREENYFCGKFCHIYRPQALDTDGLSVWCALDIEGGALVVTVPQDFLDGAKYPVRIDPDFGYGTAGASGEMTYRAACYFYKMVTVTLGDPIPANARVLSGNVHCYNASASTVHARMGLYEVHLGDIGSSLRVCNGSDITLTHLVPQWWPFPVTGPIDIGGLYSPVVVFNRLGYVSETNCRISHDHSTATGNGPATAQSCNDGSSTCIQLLVSGPVTTNVLYSVYATYELLAHMVLDKTSLVFTATQNGPLPASQTFRITNTGAGTTLDFAITDDLDSGDDWLDETPLTGASNDQTITVVPNTTAMAAGIYTSVVTVTSDNADNGPLTVDVTYTIVSPPILTVLAGWVVGNIERRDLSFKFEARSRAQHLQQQMLELYSSECRAALGDARCGVDLEDSSDGFTHAGSVAAVTEEQTKFVDTTVPDYGSDDVFRFGLVTWLDPDSGDSYQGDNAGLQMEVKRYDPVTKEFELFQPMPYAIQEGDGFTVTFGCDKSKATCADRFDNLVNFRGEPNIPGNDKLEITKKYYRA
jgi:uncharacterized phage protein (TIGR02218 family)